VWGKSKQTCLCPTDSLYIIFLTEQKLHDKPFQKLLFFCQHLGSPAGTRWTFRCGMLMAHTMVPDIPPLHLPLGKADASPRSPREAISGDTWQVET